MLCSSHANLQLLTRLARPMCCREQAAQAAANEAKAAGEEPPAIAPLFSGYSLTKEHSLGDTHCHPQPAERHLAGTPRHATPRARTATRLKQDDRAIVVDSGCGLPAHTLTLVILTRLHMFAVRA